MKPLSFAVVFISYLVLTGCGDTSGYISVLNDDNTPGNHITSIWVSSDCEDGWGDPDLYGISIANGYYAPKIEVDLEPVPEPFLNDYVDRITDVNTRFNTFDVLVCFSSGNCHDKRDIELFDGETYKIDINDHGNDVSPLEGNTKCKR